jgi:hypothetical protein
MMFEMTLEIENYIGARVFFFFEAGELKARKPLIK